MGVGAIVAVMAGSATGARAQVAQQSRNPTPPGAGFLVGGIVMAVAGGALQYYSIDRFTDAYEGDSYTINPGWVMLGGVGSLATQAGGALAAAWGWKQGEHDLAMDLSAGAPVKENRSLGLIGLGVGVLVVAGIVVGQTFVFSKAIECGFSSSDSSQVEFQRCSADSIKLATLVQLGGGAVLLGVAPLAGYGFGYDNAADRAIPGRRAGFSGLSILPAFLASGSGSGLMGLRLTGRF